MPLFLPAEERVLIIRDYAQQYGIKTFIETGTSRGDTTAALLNDFDAMYTVEIDPALARAARTRFEGHPKVEVIQGDSALVIRELVEELDGRPTLFWLDGHYCGGPGRGDIDTPIRTELEYAVQAPLGSVILVDDARLFGGREEHTEEFKDYPHVDWVRDLAYEHGLGFTLQNDIMRIVHV